MGIFSKTWVALIGAIVSALIAAFGSGGTGWTNVAIATAATGAVYMAPNTLQAPNIKTIIAVIMAALTAASSALSDGGFGPGAWLQILVAVITAAEVWLIPNKPVQDLSG